MARFKKFKAPKIATVVGSGTVITGDIGFIGGLHIDGTIQGRVFAEQDDLSAITLSEKGTIEGDIQVPNIIINGTVVGDVYASHRVELAPKAKVTGTVYYNLLEMAMGAEVNGQLIHSVDATPKRLGFDEPEERIDLDRSDDAGSVNGEQEGPGSERTPRGR